VKSIAFAALAVLLLLPSALAMAASAPGPYSPSMHGVVAGFRLAGVEPDGDPLDQVVLQTKLSSSAGVPAVNMIVSSYLENFKPDTTPVLPDLLHPSTVARNLGGFLQGKALLTDDAGNVLVLGSFLAEAFLDNTNHAVATFYGPAPAYKTIGRLRGTFSLNKNGSLAGALQGNLRLTPSNKQQILRTRGAHMKPLKQIISVVTVVPHYYGTRGVKGSGPPLHTGFTHPKGSSNPAGTSGKSPSKPKGNGISVSTWVAGGAALLCLLLAAGLYIVERRKAPTGKSETASL